MAQRYEHLERIIMSSILCFNVSYSGHLVVNVSVGAPFGAQEPRVLARIACALEEKGVRGLVALSQEFPGDFEMLMALFSLIRGYRITTITGGWNSKISHFVSIEME